MEELDAISGNLAQLNSGVSQSAMSATQGFGLQFEALLQIVLTQLQFQDPLQPIENFEFVSQLAQFSQIQQAETTNENLGALLQSGSADQAVGLLGQEVVVPAGATNLVGRVTTINFENGEPRVTIETSEGQTISNIGLNTVTEIREGT